MGQFRHSKEKTKQQFPLIFFFFSSLHDLLSAALPTLLHLLSPRFMGIIIIQYHLIFWKRICSASVAYAMDHDLLHVFLCDSFYFVDCQIALIDISGGTQVDQALGPLKTSLSAY